MKPAFRIYLAVTILAAAALACNAPVRLTTTETLFPTQAIGSDEQVAQLQTQIATLTVPTAENQMPAENPEPSFTPSQAPSVTSQASNIPASPSPTATITSAVISPTAPPTITPRASATKTLVKMPTVTPSGTRQPSATPLSQRTLAFAPFLITPPVLDGMWDEWKGHSQEYPARFVVYGLNNWTGPQDLEGSFHVAWDDTYLYLAVKIKDDIYMQNASGVDIYKGDSLEILFDRDYETDKSDHALTADDYQVGIAAGRNGIDGPKEAYLWYPRSMAGTREVKVASLRQDGVTRIEAAIPWSVLQNKPILGDRYGFALSISDNDSPNENAQQSLASNVVTRVLIDPTTWGMLVLEPAQ